MKDKLFNRKLTIYFTTGADEYGKIINKSKTLKNVCLNSEEKQLATFSSKYSILSSHTYKKTVVADYFEITNKTVEKLNLE